MNSTSSDTKTTEDEMAIYFARPVYIENYFQPLDLASHTFSTLKGFWDWTVIL